MYNFRLPLFQQLAKSGYQIHIVAPYDEYSDRLATEGRIYHPIVIDNKGHNPIRDGKTIRKFYQIYRAIRPDLIVHYTIKPNIYGSLAAFRLGIPSIAITTGLGQVFDERSVRARIAKKLYKFAFKRPEKVLFLNDDDRNIFLRRGLITQASRTEVLPGEGVDIAHFVRKEPLPVRMRSFLFVGRLLWPKGLGEFAKAARVVKAKYPDVQFNILGFINPEDPTSLTDDDLQSWEQEGIINYLGSTNRVQDFIEKTTCLVLPSYYREGVPRVLLEAASMSTPLITTDNVGCREVVKEGVNGYLVSPRDVPSLVAAMEKILTDSEESIIAMGDAGREYVREKFATASVNSRLEAIFAAALKDT